MKFWGAKVAANKNVDVILGEDELVHISQVSLDFNGYPDDVAKLFLKVGGETYTIGSLSQQKEGYMSLDLIVDENFTLSHSSNRGSVHFIGYKTPNLKALVNEGTVSIKVADPRPQPAIPNSYRQLHVPRRLRDDFLKLAKSNTVANLETCGLLAGSKQGNDYQMTTLIIPKQKSTPTSCEMLNEEEVLKVQEDLSLISLGWIHTHPKHNCYMSSVDLHTQHSYQMLLPEAVAIVVAPTDKLTPYGIFHLSDPSGLSMIRNCDQQEEFHEHENPEDGNPIYKPCSHVVLSKVPYETVDLRHRDDDDGSATMTMDKDRETAVKRKASSSKSPPVPKKARSK